MFETAERIHGHTACERTVEQCAHAVDISPRTLTAAAACGILLGSSISLEKLILKARVGSSYCGNAETREFQLALIGNIDRVGTDSAVDYPALCSIPIVVKSGGKSFETCSQLISPAFSFR